MLEPTVTESFSARHPSLGEQIGLNHGDALVIVDLQRDFLPGGSRAIAQADQIIAPINAYLAAFASRDIPIFMVRDWHPDGHCSFQQAATGRPIVCKEPMARSGHHTCRCRTAFISCPRVSIRRATTTRRSMAPRY